MLEGEIANEQEEGAPLSVGQPLRFVFCIHCIHCIHFPIVEFLLAPLVLVNKFART